MSSFSPPPFSSSPPQMGGFSPPPMDNFSPPPMSSFSPPPINGFSPPPLDDTDDVIGDHFGLRRHSDMSDDNSFDLTGFSEKMKKIEIEKMKHLPPREIIELQRESLGEQGDIFVSLNGLEVDTEQKHKKLFINNETSSFPSANNKLNIDFDETGVENPFKGVDGPVNIYEDRMEVTNEKKSVNHPESEDACSVHHPKSEDAFSVHHLSSEDAFSVHHPKSEDAFSVHHPESEDAFGDLSEPDPLDFGDFSPHQTMSEPLQFDDFSENKTSDVGDKFDLHVDENGVCSENTILDQTTEPETLDASEFISKRDDSVEHLESGDKGYNDSNDPNVLEDNTITSKVTDQVTIDGHIMATNKEDPVEYRHHILSQVPDCKTSGDFRSQQTSFEADLEKPEAFDAMDIENDAMDNENVSENGDDFDAFGAFSEESCSGSDNVKDSSGFQTNWRNFDSSESSNWVEAPNVTDPRQEESSNWIQAPNVTDPRQEIINTGIEFDSDGDDDDDDFGDFGDADNSFGELSQSVPGPATPACTNATYPSQIEEFDDLVIKLLPKVSTVIINMYETVIVEPELDDENELVDDEEGGDNLVQSVLNDPVIWSRVEDPSTAPALDYTWLQSNTYNTLLNTLNIDTRNVLDGEGWKNSVPKFAANLMTPGLLQPLSAEQGTTENVKQNAKNKELVQPAEFDWNNSGLVNPLETDGQRSKPPASSTDPISAISQSTSQRSQATPPQTTQLPSSTASSVSSISARAPDSSVLTSAPSQDCVRRKERLSREAAALLDSFPLLSFMSSSMLTFPVKSVERKGKRKT